VGCSIDALIHVTFCFLARYLSPFNAGGSLTAKVTITSPDGLSKTRSNQANIGVRRGDAHILHIAPLGFEAVLAEIGDSRRFANA